MGNGIVYDVATVENAMRCLIYMQDLEETPNFGKLTYKPSSDIPNNRYNIEEYKDRIDSTFYTDMATSTLVYTMDFLRNNFDEQFSWDLCMDIYEYGIYDYEGVDLINDSEGEFADFNGDSSILDLDIPGVFEQLYAYYSEFQLVDGDEKENIVNKLGISDSSNGIVIKKTENINGVDMDFYYVGDYFGQVDKNLFQHDYNTNFYSDRMSGGMLDAITSKYGENDIITVTEDYYQQAGINPNAAAYANIVDGYIVVRDDYFTDAICHETGHLFDQLNAFSLGNLEFSPDYNNGNFGIWDNLSKKYADDIEMIRIEADIGAGYTANSMREQHNEFYAESFQLYFYSEETRAALPQKVRSRIETEIEKYAN